MLRRNVYKTVLDNQSTRRILASNSEKVDIDYLPNPVVIKNNYSARRDPISSLIDFNQTIHETDGLSNGYREGSEWYNMLSLSKFICIESNTERTLWKKISSPFAVVNTLFYPFQVDEDEMFDIDGISLGIQQYIYLDVGVNIRDVLDIYIKDYTHITSGWLVTGSKIYFAVNEITTQFFGREAQVTLTVAGEQGDLDV